MLIGLSVCQKCDKGNYGNSTGSSFCLDCPPGQYTDLEGQTACFNCVKGTYTSVARSTSCAKCKAGTFAKNDRAAACANCAPGTFQAAEKKDACDICPTGTYSLGTATACAACGKGTINAKAGQGSCQVCIGDSIPNPEATRCVCKVGFAAKDVGNSTLCVGCPRGAVCDQPGTVWDTMETAAGYWCASQGTYYACIQASDCKGGGHIDKNGKFVSGASTGGVPQETEEQCGQNREGALCALCKNGFIATVQGLCNPCGNPTNSYAYTVFVIVLVLVALIVQYVIILKSGIELMDAAMEEDEKLKLQKRVGGESDVNLAQMNESDHYDAKMRHGDIITLKGAPPAKPDFTFKLKIALTFAQVLTNMDVGVRIEFPNAFKSFVNWLSPSNLDFVQFSSIDCIIQTSYFDRLWASCAIPIIIILLLLFFYLIPSYIAFHSDKNPKFAAKRKRARRNFWKLLMFTLFLIYPNVSSVVLRTYICKTVMDRSYLLADFQVDCNSDLYKAHASAAVPMIALYPIGIPVFFFFMLYRYRKRLDEVGIRAQLGFLYDAFERQYWWYEMVDMSFKLAITSLIAFLPEVYQLPVAMCIVWFYMAITLLNQPWMRKGDDRLMLNCLCEIVLLLMAGNIFNQYPVIDPITEVVLNIVLIAAVLTFIVYFMSTAGNAAYKLWKEHKKEVEADKRREDGETFENNAQTAENIEMGVIDRRAWRASIYAGPEGSHEVDATHKVPTIADLGLTVDENASEAQVKHQEAMLKKAALQALLESPEGHATEQAARLQAMMSTSHGTLKMASTNPLSRDDFVNTPVVFEVGGATKAGLTQGGGSTKFFGAENKYNEEKGSHKQKSAKF